MTTFANALACLLALAFSCVLWRGKITLLKESLLLLGFLLVAETFTCLACYSMGPAYENYPLRMVALSLCFSTTKLPVKRRRYLVLAQALWLWVELVGYCSFANIGMEISWIRILAIAVVGTCSSLLSKMSRNIEFCLMVLWVAIWMFF